ncbi:MAG: ABC transporter ATP-binding protein [Acetobacteraceae bacterium]|nr:ABC transporter ATP-binding protein [Acetobacteraceae bacterium]
MSLLVVDRLAHHFRTGSGTVHAVNGVSFSLAAGETLGLVGESGSGKSTIGRAVLRLIRPGSGRVVFQGADITSLPERRLRRLRGQMQIVFQDPWSALNPRMSVRRLIEEPLRLHSSLGAGERRDRAEALAGRVRLSAGMLDRYPAELSGGQLQRVCIARAIATDPALVVLDEPTSSLDLSVRAGILELLFALKEEAGAGLLFITHDLGTLRLIADRILVLYLGHVVEDGPAARVFDAPAHPYTQALLSAHLPADPAAKVSRHLLSGEVPSALVLPPGCAFAGRCPIAVARCREQQPALQPVGPSHQAACIRIAEGANRIAA